MEEAMDQLCKRMSKCFFRSELRQRFRRYLVGLLGRVDRRNGWQMAEQIGDLTPDGIHRFLHSASWSANELRDELRKYVYEAFATPDGILSVGETEFLKKGTRSVGVDRQFSRTAGKVENCQVGIFLCYASVRGTAFLDRELYLPKEWANDLPRRKQAGVPADVNFATKQQIACQMVVRSLDSGLEAAWVLADEEYGSDPAFRDELESIQQPYVVMVRSDEVVWVDWGVIWVDWGVIWVNWGNGPIVESVSEIAVSLPARAWKLSNAVDRKIDLRVYDWAWVPLVTDDNPLAEPEWEEGLLIRRSLDEVKDIAYYRTFGRSHISLERYVTTARGLWRIEDNLESAKKEVGLDEYEVRTWTAWYRYITLALLSHAFLAVLKAQMNPPPDYVSPDDKREKPFPHFPLWPLVGPALLLRHSVFFP